MAATFVAHPELARDLVHSAGAVAEMANDDLVQPFLNKGEPEAVARLDLAPPAPVQRPHDVTGQAVVAPPQPRMVQAPDVSAADPSPPDAITILPDLPQPPPAPKQVARNELPNAAPVFRIPDPPSLDAPVPSRDQLVAARLEAGLTPEMTRNFDLFLYVSKADAGPLSAKLLKNGTLRTYKGFPHGMPTTQAETINSDLLAFIRA